MKAIKWHTEKRKLFLLSPEAAKAGFPIIRDRNELLRYIAKNARIPIDRNEAKQTIVGKLLLDLAREFEILK